LTASHGSTSAFVYVRPCPGNGHRPNALAPDTVTSPDAPAELGDGRTDPTGVGDVRTLPEGPTDGDPLARGEPEAIDVPGVRRGTPASRISSDSQLASAVATTRRPTTSAAATGPRPGVAPRAGVGPRLGAWPGIGGPATARP
jgi:hypothetical protein